MNILTFLPNIVLLLYYYYLNGSKLIATKCKFINPNVTQPPTTPGGRTKDRPGSNSRTGFVNLPST